MKEYCCVATSSRAWVQQVAVSYVQRGYHRFVEVWIPRRKNYAAIDRKIIAKYNIDITDSARAWRKQQGYARYQYIRRGRFGLIMIADSEGPSSKTSLSVVMPHEKFTKLLTEYGEELYNAPCSQDSEGNVTIDFEQEEGQRTKHLYRHTICHEGYEVRYRNGHASVRMDPRCYEAVRNRLLRLANEPDLTQMKEVFKELRFQPFAPLKAQLWKLVDELNVYRAKKYIRGKKVPYSVVGRCLRRHTGPLVVSSGGNTMQNVDGKQTS